MKSERVEVDEILEVENASDLDALSGNADAVLGLSLESSSLSARNNTIGRAVQQESSFRFHVSRSPARICSLE